MNIQNEPKRNKSRSIQINAGRYETNANLIRELGFSYVDTSNSRLLVESEISAHIDQYNPLQKSQHSWMNELH